MSSSDSEDILDGLEADLSNADPLTFAMSRSLRRLDAMLERRGWDQPPSLWLVRRVDSDQTGSTSDTPVLRWEMLPTGDLFQRARAADGLQHIAQSAPELMPAVPDLVGFGFASEAFMLAAPDADDTDAMERFQQMATNRRIHRSPARIEVRTLSAVDVRGFIYGHTMPRDPMRMGRLEAAAGPGTARVRMEGAVTDALSRILSRIPRG